MRGGTIKQKQNTWERPDRSRAHTVRKKHMPWMRHLTVTTASSAPPRLLASCSADIRTQPRSMQDHGSEAAAAATAVAGEVSSQMTPQNFSKLSWDFSGVTVRYVVRRPSLNQTCAQRQKLYLCSAHAGQCEGMIR